MRIRGTGSPDVRAYGRDLGSGVGRPDSRVRAEERAGSLQPRSADLCTGVRNELCAPPSGSPGRTAPRPASSAVGRACSAARRRRKLFRAPGHARPPNAGLPRALPRIRAARRRCRASRRISGFAGRDGENSVPVPVCSRCRLDTVPESTRPGRCPGRGMPFAGFPPDGTPAVPDFRRTGFLRQAISAVRDSRRGSEVPGPRCRVRRDRAARKEESEDDGVIETRGSALRPLARVLADGSADPVLLFVEGAAGAGKSHLLRELADLPGTADVARVRWRCGTGDGPPGRTHTGGPRPCGWWTMSTGRTRTSWGGRPARGSSKAWHRVRRPLWPIVPRSCPCPVCRWALRRWGTPPV